MILLTRDLEVDTLKGRTFLGRALTYDRAYRVSDDGGRSFYAEGWRAGALTRTIDASRNLFELRAVHRDVRVGLVAFADSRTDLRFRATLDETEIGDAAIAEVTDSGMPAVSLGFRPRRAEPRAADGTIWRTQADLRELSLTDVGQYPDAKVLAHRAAPSPFSLELVAALDTVENVLRKVEDVNRLL